MTGRALAGAAFALAFVAAVWVTDLGFAEGTGAASPMMTRECKMDALERSACVIEMILKDVRDTYPLSAGGGIGSIRQLSTTRYAIELLREEHADVFTYEVEFDADQVRIVGKSGG